MIVIIGRFQIQGHKLAAFQEFAREVIPIGRQVPGCLSFDILQDVGQEDCFVMLEQWENRAALEHHFETETYADNDAMLSSMVVEDPEWEEYEV